MALNVGDIYGYLNQGGPSADVGGLGDLFGQTGDLFGSGLGGLASQFGSLSPITGAFGDIADIASGDYGGGIGGLLGAGIGSIIPGIGTMLGGLAGSALGDLVQGLFGSGVPTGAKTAGTEQVLQSSHNPLEVDLGKFMSRVYPKGGSMANNVAGGKLSALANTITYLTGQPWQGAGKNGMWSLPAPSGAPYSKPTTLYAIDTPEKAVQFEGTPSPNLTAQQVLQIMPQLEHMVLTNKPPGTGHGHFLTQDAEQINQLVQQVKNGQIPVNPGQPGVGPGGKPIPTGRPRPGVTGGKRKPGTGPQPTPTIPSGGQNFGNSNNNNNQNQNNNPLASILPLLLSGLFSFGAVGTPGSSGVALPGISSGLMQMV